MLLNLNSKAEALRAINDPKDIRQIYIDVCDNLIPVFKWQAIDFLKAVDPLEHSIDVSRTKQGFLIIRINTLTINF